MIQTIMQLVCFRVSCSNASGRRTCWSTFGWPQSPLCSRGDAKIRACDSGGSARKWMPMKLVPRVLLFQFSQNQNNETHPKWMPIRLLPKMLSLGFMTNRNNETHPKWMPLRSAKDVYIKLFVHNSFDYIEWKYLLIQIHECVHIFGAGDKNQWMPMGVWFLQ